MKKRLGEVLEKLEWKKATSSAKGWWRVFVKEHSNRLAPVLRLAEQLLQRKTSINEWFLAVYYSNVNNRAAILLYLDYTILKNQEQSGRSKAAEKDIEQRTKASAGVESKQSDPLGDFLEGLSNPQEES